MTLLQVLAILRARRTGVGRVLAIVVGAAIAAAMLLPNRYTATARVLVEAGRPDAMPGSPLPLRPMPGFMATQVDIATSQRVALKVVETLKIAEDPAAIAEWREQTGGAGSIRHHFSDRLLNDLDVTPSRESSVLSIAFTANDPRFAAAVANAFADAYAGLALELRADAARQAGASLDARLGTLREALESAQRRRDERDIESAQREFDAAARRASQLAVEGPSGQANVVLLTPAVEPGRPSSPRPGLLVGAALLAGGLLGVGGALMSEWRDRRVRSPQDLQRASGQPPMGTLRDAFSGGVAPPSGGAPERPDGPDAPEPTPQPERARGHVPIGQILVTAGLIHPPEVERIIAWARADGVRFGEAAVAHKVVTEAQIEQALARQFDYPVLQSGATRVSSEVVAAFDARNPMVADLRRLRARIRSAQLAAPPAAPLKSFAVISSGAGDGKTFVAANLAVTFSQLGQRTMLIDADLRQGRLHALFGLDNRTGLSTMLNRRIEPGSIQRVPGLPDLSIVPCGPGAPNPSELLSRDVFAHLLASFARAYDVVILDTAGVAEEPDATLVAQRAGAALVVARKDRSTFDAVFELMQPGGGPNVPVLGSVLNVA